MIEEEEEEEEELPTMEGPEKVVLIDQRSSHGFLLFLLFVIRWRRQSGKGMVMVMVMAWGPMEVKEKRAMHGIAFVRALNLSNLE